MNILTTIVFKEYLSSLEHTKTGAVIQEGSFSMSSSVRTQRSVFTGSSISVCLIRLMRSVWVVSFDLIYCIKICILYTAICAQPLS